jgi:hypothetical protein
MAYDSNASGREEVYMRSFPAGQHETPISRNGGWSPRWRADGKELFFLALDGTLRSAGIETRQDLHTSAPQPLFQTGIGLGNNHPFAVARDGQRFLMAVGNPAGLANSITVVLNWPAWKYSTEAAAIGRSR